MQFRILLPSYLFNGDCRGPLLSSRAMASACSSICRALILRNGSHVQSPYEERHQNANVQGWSFQVARNAESLVRCTTLVVIKWDE